MLTPVSYNEEGAWIESRQEPARFVRRILRVTAALPPGLGTAAVRAVADRLVRRHPILRTAYPTVGGEPRRLVLDECAHEVCDGRPDALPDPGSELRPSDLVRLWRAGNGAAQVGLDLSEMISDPWSCARLQAELAGLLAAAAAGETPALAPVPATYAEFAVEQRDSVASGRSAEQRDYWRGQLGGAASATCLRPDGPDPGGDAAGERICVLTEELMGCLRTVTGRHRRTSRHPRWTCVDRIYLAIIAAALLRFLGASRLYVTRTADHVPHFRTVFRPAEKGSLAKRWLKKGRP